MITLAPQSAVPSVMFWRWMDDAMKYEIALGCKDEDIAARRDYLMRSVLYLTPVAGHC